MMQFTEETKKKIVELCQINKVQKLSLFGSRARGDNRSDSDYDFLIEFIPNSGASLFELSGMRLDLEELLEIHVDLATKKGLKLRIRDQILAEADLIYAV